MSRSELATQQTALLRALVAGGPCPDGFDAGRLKAAARSLDRKRLREAADAWPLLERDLGTEFETRFTSFAAKSPRPSWGGPLADGFAFARTLPSRLLSDETRFAMLSIRLNFRWRNGLRLRRGPWLATAWLREGRRLVIAMRLPWFGVYSMTLPLGR